MTPPPLVWCALLLTAQDQKQGAIAAGAPETFPVSHHPLGIPELLCRRKENKPLSIVSLWNTRISPTRSRAEQLIEQYLSGRRRIGRVRSVAIQWC